MEMLINVQDELHSKRVQYFNFMTNEIKIHMAHETHYHFVSLAWEKNQFLCLSAVYVFLKTTSSYPSFIFFISDKQPSIQLTSKIPCVYHSLALVTISGFRVFLTSLKFPMPPVLFKLIRGLYNIYKLVGVLTFTTLHCDKISQKSLDFLIQAIFLHHMRY